MYHEITQAYDTLEKKASTKQKNEASQLLNSFGINPFDSKLEKRIHANHRIITYVANTLYQVSPYSYAVNKPTIDELITCCSETVKVLENYLDKPTNDKKKNAPVNRCIQFLYLVQNKKKYYENWLAPLADVYEPFQIAKNNKEN